MPFCKNLDIRVRIVFLATEHIDARFVSRFLRAKLLQKFPMKSAFFYVFNRLALCRLKAYLYGYKILLSGRFARRGRAKYFWKHKGGVPFSSIGGCVDYNLSLVVLSNSICGIKVWVRYRRHKILEIF